MKQKIIYTDEPMDVGELVPDLLPPASEIALAIKNLITPEERELEKKRRRIKKDIPALIP